MRNESSTNGRTRNPHRGKAHERSEGGRAMSEPWESFDDVMKGVSWQTYVRRKDERIHALESEKAALEARVKELEAQVLRTYAGLDGFRDSLGR